MNSIFRYVPHIPFIFAQIYCGALLILSTGPSVSYILASATGKNANIGFGYLLLSFPGFWKDILDLGLAQLLVILVLLHPVGIGFAEVFYRFNRWIGYHKDMNPKEPKKDLTPEEEKEMFVFTTRLQGHSTLAGIWEWENFQSSLFYYFEAVSVVSIFLFLMAFLYTCIMIGTNVCLDSQFLSMVFSIGLVVVGVVVWLLLRKGRIEKYRSFHLAHEAIEKLMNEEDTKKEGVRNGN